MSVVAGEVDEHPSTNSVDDSSSMFTDGSDCYEEISGSCTESSDDLKQLNEELDALIANQDNETGAEIDVHVATNIGAAEVFEEFVTELVACIT